MNGNQPQPPQQPRPGAKPGAMTMAMRAVQAPTGGPKVLRIGVIQGGKIIEERVIRRRETVSVGTSEKNHFIVQAQGLPSRFDLFQLVGNDYILNFTDQMRGRVALPGGVQDLDQLRQSGGARNAGTHFQVKLGESSRGKIVVGNTTLLFQFVVPPPVTPRPQLPAAARGGFVKGIDWLFTAFVVFSYMIFFGFIVYLESADWPIDQGIDAIPDELSRFIFDEPEPPPPDEEPEVVEDAEATEEVAEAETQQPSRSNNNSNASPSRNQESNAEATARIREEAAAQAQQMLLGALGEGGALADVLAGGAVTGNAADVLAQAEGVGVADAQGGTLRERSGGGSSGRTGGLGGLQRAGGGATGPVQAGEQIVERVIRGRVNFENMDEIGGSGMFDQSQVTSMIRQRQSAFRRCYENELRNNPSLSGKVTVQFTIEERGNVSRANAVENTTNSAGLATCVVGVIRRLRWSQGPDGGSVDYRYPFVFAPQN